MSNPNEPTEKSSQSDDGPSNLAIGVFMVVGVGALMLIGYLFR